MKRNRVGLGSVWTLFALWTGFGALYAGEQEFCTRYAEQAISQFKEAQSLGCPDLKYPVWSSDANHHYHWCMGVSEEEVNSGTKIRVDALARCKSEAGAVAVEGTVVGIGRAELPQDLLSNRLDPCVQYALNAVEQNRRNLEQGCGYRGPQWNSTYEDHFNWCSRGDNGNMAPHEAQAREEALNRCVPTASPAPGGSTAIDPGPQQPGELISRDQVSPIAFERAEQLARFARTWREVETPELASVNLELRSGLEERRRQRRALLQSEFESAALAKDAEFTAVNQMISAFEQRRFANPSAIQDRAIFDVRGIPNQNVLEPDGFALVAGRNFGTLGGSVYLEYEEERTETEIFNRRPAKKHSVALQPYRGNWADSWFDNLIVVRLPHALPGKRLYSTEAGRSAMLVVRGPGAAGFTLQKSVAIRAAFPEVRKVETTSGQVTYGGRLIEKKWWHSKDGEHFFIIGKRAGDRVGPWIQSGDDLFIYGTGFGASPGSVRLKLSEPIGRKWDLRLLPGESNWWRDNRIHVKAEEVPGNYTIRGASLSVLNDQGREWLSDGYAFGPRFSLRVVSGLRWFEPDNKEAKDTASPSTSDDALLVSHHPGCGVSFLLFRTGHGESGTDWFLRNRKFPENVELHAVHFKQIQPGAGGAGLAQFAKTIGKAALAFATGGPMGVFNFFGANGLELIGEGLFGSGAYYASILPPTDTDTSVGIRWANMCAGEYVDVPLVYLVSFVVSGPEPALEGL